MTMTIKTSPEVKTALLSIARCHASHVNAGRLPDLPSRVLVSVQRVGPGVTRALAVSAGMTIGHVEHQAGRAVHGFCAECKVVTRWFDELARAERAAIPGK